MKTAISPAVTFFMLAKIVEGLLIVVYKAVIVDSDLTREKNDICEADVSILVFFFSFLCHFLDGSTDFTQKYAITVKCRNSF